MRRSHTIVTTIHYPFAPTYDYLSDPANFGDWAAIEHGTYHALDNGDWTGSTAMGERLFRFSQTNDFGVLDHAMFKAGEVPLFTPMRLVRNQEGCELQFTFFCRDGMSDAEFDSALEWITTDFLGLKSLLEARTQRRA